MSEVRWSCTWTEEGTTWRVLTRGSKEQGGDMVLRALREEGVGQDGGIHGQAMAMATWMMPSRGYVSGRAWQDSSHGRPGEEARKGKGGMVAGGDAGPACG